MQAKVSEVTVQVRRERSERTTQGYRRFRCACGKQFNERTGGLLNRAQYPSDVIALVVLWRLRYKLSLRDLAERFLLCGFVLTMRLFGAGSQLTGTGGGSAPETEEQGRPQLQAHAAFWTHVSSRQIRKALARARRCWDAVIR
jgi:hypothetical protein